METLHLTDWPSAIDAIRGALARSPGHEDDSVEWFPEDYSEGPLEPDSATVRHEWWRWWREMVVAQTGWNPEDLARSDELTAFWNKVATAPHLVVWYSRDWAGEWSFFHAMCDKLADRPFDIVELPRAVVSYTADEHVEHLATARPITLTEHSAARRTWDLLKMQNQTFRIINDGELISAPADHYDAAILDAASLDWTPVVRAVQPVMAEMKVGDATLFWRVKSLIESGQLVSDGDPWLPEQTRIKRAQP